METVLGLSLTSTSIGWVLLDGPDADANTLDHDAFDLGAGTANDGDISKHTAAVRGAQSIAASSGHQVNSIGVTWTDDADGKAMLLLKALPDLGFGDVVSVKLTEATRTWARAFGRTLEFEKCAVCVVESTAVTALSYGYDSVRTFATHMRESADGLGRWLNDIFESNKFQPDTLFLVGSRGDVELISGSLSDALPVPVDSSDDAQLALARGAALKVAATTAAASDDEAAEEPADHKPARRWPRLRHHPPVATATDDLEAWTAALKKPPRKATFDHGPTHHQAVTHPAESPSATTDIIEPKPEDEPDTPVETPTAILETPTAVVETKIDVVETKSEVIDNVVAEKPDVEKPVIDKQVIHAPADDTPAKHRSWYGSHARAATVLAAGVVAVFVVVPMVTGQKESAPVETQAASDSTTTSVSVHAVPSPKPVLPPPAAVQPVAAQPAPPPPPPAAVPPPQEAISPATDSGSGQDAVTPIEEPVTAQPMVAPQAPAAAPEPVAPEAVAPQPVVAPQPPVAPPPLVAPQAQLALPAEAPPPAAAPQPFVAPQAPLAPPAAVAPPPPGAPPAPAPPPEGAPAPSPPLPPDPVMAVLSPFFGALP